MKSLKTSNQNWKPVKIDEETRLKLMLIGIIQRTFGRHYERFLELVKQSIITAHWNVQPKGYPSIVTCTFAHGDTPLFTFSLAPELKPTLADYFSKSFSQRINTEHEQTLIDAQTNIFTILKSITRK